MRVCSIISECPTDLSLMLSDRQVPKSIPEDPPRWTLPAMRAATFVESTGRGKLDVQPRK